jgi:hypothetical protein
LAVFPPWKVFLPQIALQFIADRALPARNRRNDNGLPEKDPEKFEQQVQLVCQTYLAAPTLSCRAAGRDRGEHVGPEGQEWHPEVNGQPTRIVFGIVTRRAIRRASFKSTEELKARLLDFIDYFNRTFAQPFRWTYTGRPVANTTVKRRQIGTGNSRPR